MIPSSLVQTYFIVLGDCGLIGGINRSAHNVDLALRE
jgi:hypothetical protein